MENNNQTVKYNPDEYVKLADEIYLSKIRDGNYEDIVAGMSQLGDYTLRNQLLIQQQMPGASYVDTMNGWNFRKRNIIKGQKGIKILAPVFDKKVFTETDGSITEKTSDFVTGYKINFVFDVSQTEGEAFSETVGPDSLREYYAEVEAGLKNAMTTYTFDEQEIENEGILETQNRTITLKSGLDKEAKMKALIKQISAALVVGRDRSKFYGFKSNQMPNITAIESGAAAYIVTKRLGLPTDKLILPDFENMKDEEISKFAYNIGVIRSVSQFMLLHIQNELSEKKLEKAIYEIEGSNPVSVKTTTKTKVKSMTKAEAEL